MKYLLTFQPRLQNKQIQNRNIFFWILQFKVGNNDYSAGYILGLHFPRGFRMVLLLCPLVGSIQPHVFPEGLDKAMWNFFWKSVSVLEIALIDKWSCHSQPLGHSGVKSNPKAKCVIMLWLIPYCIAPLIAITCGRVTT